jgi:hypothetical protein
MEVLLLNIELLYQALASIIEDRENVKVEFKIERKESVKKDE